jgi:hypothetical protein
MIILVPNQDLIGFVGDIVVSEYADMTLIVAVNS